jgi:hypothetical protein
MSELEQLQSENRRLRNENALLELHCADLESKLDATMDTIAELESQELDNCPLVGGDEEQVYYASKNRNKFHRLSSNRRHVDGVRRGHTFAAQSELTVSAEYGIK